jgi:hypothetical protein
MTSDPETYRIIIRPIVIRFSSYFGGKHQPFEDFIENGIKIRPPANFGSTKCLKFIIISYIRVISDCCLNKK